MPVSKTEPVVLARCEHYDPREVRTALEQIFAPYGDVKALVKPGQKILLKPNLLAAAPPSEAVTTHPVIIREMALMLRELGCRVFIGDSPGRDSQDKAYRICGIQDVIKATGSEALFFTETVYKKVEGFRLWEIPLAAELEQVDLIINLAKLKTHSFTGLTAAVKNMYGCVPGNTKARLHFEYPLPRDFSRLLLDVYYAVQPAFSILDAVIAMQGAGPRKGRPRRVGLLMGSSNALALDNIAASLLGFRYNQVATLAAAKELNLSGADPNSVLIKGLDPVRHRLTDFDRGPASKGRFGSLLALFPLALFREYLSARRPYPWVDLNLCNGCRVCYQSCPARAIVIKKSIPEIDHDKCIRCYCCQEFCSHGAIKMPGG